MAKTTFSTNNALTKKAWEEKLHRDAVKESYFMPRFAGEGANSVVQVKTQLEKGKGDKITFGIRMRLTGTGVTSGTILEGNEEKLSTYDYSVSLEQYRHAVRDDGALSRKRAMFSVDEESKDALKDWGGEKIDQLIFNALFTSPTKIAYPSSGAGAFQVTGTPATAKAAMSATNGLLTPGFISDLKTYAKTGGNRSFVPLRPVKVEGKNYYILLLHPDACNDLRKNSTLQAAWRDAAERGSSNPLFKDATLIWDGVIVHEHENCPIATDGGGASVAWAQGALLGAQSLVWAWGERGEVVQETFDYGNEHGYAWGMMAATGKPVFNSLDYGSIGVYVARSKISDL